MTSLASGSGLDRVGLGEGRGRSHQIVKKIMFGTNIGAHREQTGHCRSVQAGKIGTQKPSFSLSINLVIFNNLRKQTRETRRAQAGSLYLRNVQRSPQKKERKQNKHLRLVPLADYQLGLHQSVQAMRRQI